ncbi:MAG: hypothetical protein JWL81_1451, partial [Verrucomicrobiales bacterium]|nr:hypothetical protein [Verrucomicrobiales bacterium]
MKQRRVPGKAAPGQSPRNFRPPTPVAAGRVLPVVTVAHSILLAGGFLLARPATASAVDGNNNQQSDLWEMVFQAAGLPAAGDADHDGFSNTSESSAGTDPFSPSSFPLLSAEIAGNLTHLSFELPAGKTAQLLTAPDPAAPWVPLGSPILGLGQPDDFDVPITSNRAFFKLRIGDADTDGDGLTDYEENLIGFNAGRQNSQRSALTDSARAVAGLTGNNVLTVGVYDDTTSERWPEPGLFVIRRAGTGLQPLTATLTFSG